ncbi:mucin-21-like [Vespa velutina]|uniref:mucin-21-like n=1 Tax=Vespa velutina TaxID=202808 RepID=UPI001FB20FFB|nr:mucin-21-like [Vespa velutina]
MAKTSTGGGVSYGVVPEMRHSKSEDLLGAIPNSRSTSPTIGLLPSTASEDDLIAASALHESTDRHRHRVVVAAAAAAAAAAAIADTTRRLPPSSSTTSSSPSSSSSSSTKTPNKNNDNRSTLERARLDVIRQATVIRAERDALEKENETLKEKLRIGEDELGIERRRREEGVAALTRETITLRHAARHLRAATLHATSCRRRRRCSICLYTQRTFAEVDDYRDDGNLFKCLQAPLQDLCTWLRPNTTTTAGPSSRTPRTSSPLAEREIAYIDDSSVDSSGGGSTNGSSDSTTSSTTSNSSSNSASDDEAYPSTLVAAMSLSSANSNVPPTNRAFSSDSGFSSEVGDRRSRCFENGCSSTSSSSGCSKTRKISESLSCSEPDDQGTMGRGGGSSGGGGSGGRGGGGFTRSKWTSSFRKLLGRKLKSKSATTSNDGGGGGSSS